MTSELASFQAQRPSSLVLVYLWRTFWFQAVILWPLLSWTLLFVGPHPTNLEHCLTSSHSQWYCPAPSLLRCHWVHSGDWVWRRMLQTWTVICRSEPWCSVSCPRCCWGWSWTYFYWFHFQVPCALWTVEPVSLLSASCRKSCESEIEVQVFSSLHGWLRVYLALTFWWVDLQRTSHHCHWSRHFLELNQQMVDYPSFTPYLLT